MAYTTPLYFLIFIGDVYKIITCSKKVKENIKKLAWLNVRCSTVSHCWQKVTIRHKEVPSRMHTNAHLTRYCHQLYLKPSTCKTDNCLFTYFTPVNVVNRYTATQFNQDPVILVWLIANQLHSSAPHTSFQAVANQSVTCSCNITPVFHVKTQQSTLWRSVSKPPKLASHLLPPEKHHLGLHPRGHSYA